MSKYYNEKLPYFYIPNCEIRSGPPLENENIPSVLLFIPLLYSKEKKF